MKNKRGKSKVQNQEVRTLPCYPAFIEAVDEMNDYFADYFHVEIVDQNVAIFPGGSIWICEDCPWIHIGLHVGTDPQFGWHIALALNEYTPAIEFHSMPVFITDDGKAFEDDRAYFEFFRSAILEMAGAYHRAKSLH